MNSESNNIENNNENLQNNLNEQNTEIQSTEPQVTENVVVEQPQTIGPQTTSVTNIGNNLEGPKKSNKLVIIIIAIILIAAVGVGAFFLLNKPSSDNNTNTNKENTTNTVVDVPSLDDAILLEDVRFNGYGCFTSGCTFEILDGNNIVEYSYSRINPEGTILTSLDGYSSYVKLNIYYTENEGKRTIVDYKLLLRSTNEELENIKSESDLRSKLGLFPLGKNIETLTLKEIGESNTWYSYDKDNKETPNETVDYVFIDSNNNEYQMSYDNPSSDLKLVVGNKYKVTFNVDLFFDIDKYTIINIE